MKEIKKFLKTKDIEVIYENIDNIIKEKEREIFELDDYSCCIENYMLYIKENIINYQKQLNNIKDTKQKKEILNYINK